jgi:predicted transposase/invertase (TIGR01784 family)
MLKYKFTNDTLFKVLFVKFPELLKKLVSELLGIPLENIEQFEITNPDLPPEAIGEKFCRLDINMLIDGQPTDLEVQVRDEGDYPERSLYYWAREYSSSLPAGGDYAELPQVVVISIVAFSLFECPELHSEFQVLEISRHEPLTDRLSLHYFELPKLSGEVGQFRGQKLWLALFNAKTEEDLSKLESLEVPEMKQAIGAYRNVTASPEFRELERLRSLARSNEAAALRHERELADAEWKVVVADKDAALADKDAALADKDAALAEQATEIARLKAQIEGRL